MPTIGRRRLLASAAAFGGLAAMPRWASAQQVEEPVLLYGSSGGIVEDVLREVVFAPFTAETGIEVRTAPLPNAAKIQAMVQTGTVDVDLWESEGKELRILGGRDLLEPVDYGRLPGVAEDLIEGSVHEFGISNVLFGVGIAYRSDEFPNGHPTSWTEFWDVERFPGPRTLPDAAYQVSPIEAALLADGVAPADLYPLDIDRAFAALDRIRPDVVKFWATSAEGLNLVAGANASAGMLTLGRIITMKHRNEDPGVDIEFNQAFVKRSFFCIPKSAPHYGNVHRYMEFYFRPEVQAAFINAYPAYGATSIGAQSQLTEQTQALSIGAPARFDKLIAIDDEWWAAAAADGRSNYEAVLDRWLSWVSQ